MPYEKSSFQNFLLRFNGPSRTIVFNYSIYHFDDFLTAFDTEFMKKKQLVFKMNIKSFDKFLVSHKDLRSRNLSQWNDDPLKILQNLHGNMYSLTIFCKVLIIWDLQCYRSVIFQLKSTSRIKNQVSKTFD